MVDRAKPEGPLGRLPPTRPLYQGHFKGEDWVVGEVLAIGDQQVTLQTPEGKEVVVTWDETTRLPLGGDFEEGNLVRAVGEWQDGTLKAKGILRHQGLPHFQPNFSPGPAGNSGEVKGRFRLR